MLKKLTLLMAISLIFSSISYSQKPQPKKGKAPMAKPVLLKCHILGDTANTGKISIPAITAWFDKTPLEVADAAGKVYTITQYNLTMITMSPLQTRDFGVASDVVPLLAKKALAAIKPGDTIFLKEISAKDSAGQEIKLANIIFSAGE